MNNEAWTVPPGAAQPMGIQSTAGAVIITNEKGEVSMKKVKVQRYVSGKRPDYAKASSGEEESDDEDFTRPNRGPTQGSPPIHKDLTEAEMADPRLRRLMANRQEFPDNDNDNDEDADIPRRRVIHQAEVVDMSEGEDEPDSPRGGTTAATPLEGQRIRLGDSDSESEGEVDEDELALRRLKVRERAMQKTQQEEELLGKEDEGASEESSEEESSEYSEETDSEEEGPRLKPVFVRKKERVTIQQKEQDETKRKQQELENGRRISERRHETLRMIENEHRQNNAAKNAIDEGDPLNSVNTDDEADDAEYEAWKVRELRRLKRDKEEREAEEKAGEEIDKIRHMTEEERRIELRNNPKLITNKATKGKYKFLQKYYHRGAFFLDNEEDVFKRDFSGATLEDHFDKTILPKVMQVKNFGRSGRTKYTHLVDQDTTSFDSPWASDTQMNHKFFNSNAAGMKQMFERPSATTKKNTQTNSSSTVRK